MFKEIFPILICLSHHKNSDIAQKIYELNSLIKKNIIADIFEFNNNININNNHDLKSEKYTYKMLIDDECFESEAINVDIKESKSSNANHNTNKINNKINYNNNNKPLNTTNNKLSESEKLNSNNNNNNNNTLESEDKKFDLKIEALKKLILQELAVNQRNSLAKAASFKADNCASAHANKQSNACLLRNLSTAGKAKEKANCTEKAEKEAVNNFENFAPEKKNKKNKLYKNALNVNNNPNSSINNSVYSSFINNGINKNNNSNKNNENSKSGFFNSKEENKKDNFNKENIYNCENCVIDNTNMLTTETYNIDSSILSLKENNLIGMTTAFQNSRLRRNSSVDYKEKTSKGKTTRKSSTNSKSILNFIKIFVCFFCFALNLNKIL